MGVPQLRVDARDDRAPDPNGDWVLYWMIATRRPGWNFGLERALEWSAGLGKPLLVLEALRSDHDWASDRLHRFVVDGMADNARALAAARIAYFPYLEPEPGAGEGLLAALAARACMVVTDEFPCFFLPRMVAAAAARLDVRLETVDSNGILPLRAGDRAHPTAYSFRRFLQRTLPEHLDEPPLPDPLVDADAARCGDAGRGLRAGLRRIGVDECTLERWPVAFDDPEAADDLPLGHLAIDHSVPPVRRRGGAAAGTERLHAFIRDDLATYGEGRDDPANDRSSRLSPYLHFGHVAAWQVLEAVARAEEWSPQDVSSEARGKRHGWWGMSPGAERFLDQLVTWRELGFNTTSMCDDYDRYESLPDWALGTLAEHARDPRPRVYGLEQFERASTHDELWNAVQRQLLVEGRIHRYLRMLWGKKILHWSESPTMALEIMLQLNDKYAVDGRDPNSWSGIFWCLGRYDRPWGPERKVFGKVRYMSCANTRRKYSLGAYLERYGDPGPPELLDTFE